jgi:hypothetical protein
VKKNHKQVVFYFHIFLKKKVAFPKKN